MKNIFIVCFLLLSGAGCSQKESLENYPSVFNGELKGWTESFKNFDIHSFTNCSVRDFHEETKINIKDSSWKNYMDLYKPILSFSPDGRKFVDIYEYSLDLEKRNDSIFANFAGETQTYLYDLNNKTQTKLFFLGFQGEAQDVAWIDNDKFIITVTQNTDDTSQVEPRIYLGDCKKRKLYDFTSSDSTCCQEIRGYSYPTKLDSLKIYDYP